MFEPTVYNVLVTPLLVAVPALVLYAVYARLTMPLDYRRISSRVPSLTKSLWSEILVSWDLATKNTSGMRNVTRPFFAFTGGGSRSKTAGYGRNGLRCVLLDSLE